WAFPALTELQPPRPPPPPPPPPRGHAPQGGASPAVGQGGAGSDIAGGPQEGPDDQAEEEGQGRGQHHALVRARRSSAGRAAALGAPRAAVAHRPVDPSISSRRMSAWPAWRAVSSRRWSRTQRRLVGPSGPGWAAGAPRSM